MNIPTFGGTAFNGVQAPAARATSCRASRSARPTATSARTPTPSSSRTASSSSACRSTTRRPTTSWPSCSCSSRMDPDRDIIMYINSPGGSFTAMTAIYDTMQYIRPQIQTVVLGQAASAAAVHRRRRARRASASRCRTRACSSTSPPSARPAAARRRDIEIQAAEILRMRAWLEETLSRHSNRTPGAGQQRHRARQDPLGRRGARVRPHRPGAHLAARACRRSRAERRCEHAADVAAERRPRHPPRSRASGCPVHDAEPSSSRRFATGELGSVSIPQAYPPTGRSRARLGTGSSRGRH